jgi:hypothetical protein
MTDELPGLHDDPPEDERDENEPDENETEHEEPEEKPPEPSVWERRAKSRERKLRAAQAELAKLKAEQNGRTEPDPVEIANRRLVRAEAGRTLAAAGITDRGVQRDVLSVLDLSGIAVDEDGEVDTDAIEERIETLQRVFATRDTKDTKGGTRSPKVDTRDRGGRAPGKPADPDEARYSRILGQRG